MNAGLSFDRETNASNCWNREVNPCLFSFEFESRRADGCSFTDVVDGYFEERSAPFKVLPKYVHDAAGFGDCPSFCFGDF